LFSKKACDGFGGRKKKKKKKKKKEEERRMEDLTPFAVEEFNI